ncbi:MAG: PilZ domain-containing protein [candidate division FCPU426 bacterium]
MNNLQIKYYIVDDEYAAALLLDPAYSETTPEKMAATARPNTVLSAVTKQVSEEGLQVVSDQPIPMGTFVVCDITIPKLPLPLRALGEVSRTDSSKGRVVDRTLSAYHSGLKVLAVNVDDLKRLENYVIQENIKTRMSGR